MAKNPVEESLAEMEYALRKEEAPALYKNHDIGFSIIEADDDEQRAVGIRVFRIGEEFFYAPMFFYKGDLLGAELMYVKRDDLFVPFEEEWVNYLRSKEPFLLGRATDEEFKGTEPDFSTISEPPSVEGSSTGTIQKLSSADGIKKTMHRGLVDVDLEQMVKDADEDARSGLLRAMTKNAEFGEALANRHPDIFDWFEDEEQEKEAAVRPDTDEGLPLGMSINQPGDTSSTSAELGEKANKDRTGAPRPAGSQLVTKLPSKLVIPSKTGFYKVLVKDGIVDALVLVPKDPADNDATKRVMVIDLEDGKGDQINQRDLCAKNADDPTPWSEKYDDIPARVTFETGNRYLFVGPEQDQTYGPIRVDSITKLENGQTKLCSGRKDVFLTKSSGRPVELESKKRIMMPKTWKAMKVGSKPMEFQSVDETILAKGLPLQVKKAEVGCIVEGPDNRKHASNRKEACTHLQDQYGVSESSSNKIMHDFYNVGRELFIIKQAAPAPAMQDMVAPPGGTPLPAGPVGAGAPAPQTPPPAGPAGPGAPAPQAPLSSEAQQALEAAMQAQEQGQGSVLDMAALSTALESSSAAKFVRKYLGDLLTGIDRAGRILYRIYWDMDEFKESFGAEELNQLIETLKTGFSAYGDVFLTLKEKLSGAEDLPLFEQ